MKIIKPKFKVGDQFYRESREKEGLVWEIVSIDGEGTTYRVVQAKWDFDPKEQYTMETSAFEVTRDPFHIYQDGLDRILDKI